MRPAAYVRLFALVALLATAAVAGFNAAGEAVIARHPQAGSLQLLNAFARVIKPAWLEASDADTVIIGNSRVRDGFDPVLIRRELNLDVFNYGVSGATAYETFRYAQDALARPTTRTVIFGAQAFAAGAPGQPTGFGFEENRLAVTAGDEPTPGRAFRLGATRLLSGGALGLHAQALTLLTLLGPASAQDRADLFSPYRPMTAADLARGQRHQAERSVRMTPWTLRQMDRTLDLFCGSEVRAVVFFEPDHFSVTAAWAANDAARLNAFKAQVAAAVARRNRTCGSHIALYDFMRLGPVTGERLSPGAASAYYREPVHFRPTTGVLVLRRVLGLPGQLPGFGVEVPDGTDPAAATRADLSRWRADGGGAAAQQGLGP